MKKTIRTNWERLCYYTCRPFYGAPDTSGKIDIYSSRMLSKFNLLHRLIFKRFYNKMRVDEDSMNEFEKLGDNALPIYVTNNIGQLEYNYFNHLFLERDLPLASFANGISNALWMPFKRFRKTRVTKRYTRIKNRGSLPHPVSSGYVENLILDDKIILARLRSTKIHNDLFWELPTEDIVRALISAQKKTTKDLMLIPLQFLWAKRPQKHSRSWIDWLFGERENPGTFRKLVLFARNYKRNAVVHVGEPVSLRDFLEAHPSIPDDEAARILRKTLLDHIRAERKKITGPALKPRRWIIDQIVESEAVQKEAYKIATEHEKNVDDVKLLATKYAKEIAADINYSYVEFGCRVLKWVFNSMYEGVQYNNKVLSKIKDLAKNNPIIFVPNHRSHVDYLLLSELLYDNNIAVPHVAAGINLSFWPIGKLFRSGGAFFIRRSFGGDSLYKTVFETYLSLLLKEGYCQEFFIEGGRSRTGKLRQPKMGILSMLTEGLLTGASENAYFVPTSITYDRVVEENEYLHEAAGGKKRREKLRDIFRLNRIRKHRYGKIYLNFGEPISFNNYRNDEKIKIVERLAYDIMSSLGSGSVVTPQSLVAAAFLMEVKRGITRKKLFSNALLIKNYLVYRGAQLTESILHNEQKSIDEALQQMIDSKTIEVHEDFDPVYFSVTPDKRSGLSFQKNTIVHFLLPIAYLASSLKAMMKAGSDTFSRDELRQKVEILRSLFIFEFAAHQELVKKKEIDCAIDYMVNEGILELKDDKIAITTLGSEKIRQYSMIIADIFDSYKIAYFTCRNQLSGEKAIGHKALLKSMFEFGKHMLCLDQINHQEAINNQAFENSISLFSKIGLLFKEIPVLKVKDSPEYRLNNKLADESKLQEELELFA